MPDRKEKNTDHLQEKWRMSKHKHIQLEWPAKKKERLIAKEKAGKRTRNGVKKRKNNEIARMRQKDILLHLVCIRSSDINYNQMFSAEF